MIEENGLIIEGRQVDYIFFPGEPRVVSHAEYRFVNRTAQAKTCAVNSCYFIDNDKAIPLSVFYIYAGDLLLEKVITIPPASDLNIRVTFPFYKVSVGIKFRYAVQLNLECDSRQYDVISKLNIIQEKS